MFVGRGDELRILEHAVDEAADGRTRVVALTGEPGIGKTALAFEVARRAETKVAGARVASGRAWQDGGAPALFWWHECLRELGVDIASGGAVLGDASRFAALAAISERVREVARAAPLTVLVLDDAQWADIASLQALKLLARTARSDRLCIIVTIREPNDASADVAAALADVRREATVLALAGLERPAIAELVRERGLADVAIDALERATGGNALFALEILADRDSRNALIGGDAVPAPRGVHDVLARHLARLSTRARDVVAWASVFGQPIHAGAIATAARLAPEAVASALDDACREHVLTRAGGTLRFAHDLFRSAAYEEIPPERRRTMHEAFAEGARDVLERVRHLLAARADVADIETARLALDGARLAITRLAYEEAMTLARRAADVFERSGAKADHAIALALSAEATILCGDVEASQRLAQRALDVAEESGDAVAYARAALAFGLRRTLGLPNRDIAVALDRALVKLDAAGVKDVALRCPIEARLAAALQPIMDPPRALALARGTIARARETGDPVVLARTIHGARAAFRMLEPLEERRAMDRELLELAEKLGDRPLAAEACARVYWTSVEAGESLAAETTLLDLERTAADLRLPNHQLAARMARFARELMQGHFERANEVLAEVDATRDRWLPASGTAWPFDPVIVLRLNHFFVAGGTPPPTPENIPKPIAELFRVAIAAGAGRIDEAAAAFPTLADMLLGGEVWYVARFQLAEICARIGAKAYADRLYDLCSPFAGRHVVWTPLPGYAGAADSRLAALANLRGDTKTAIRHYDDAIAMEEKLGATALAKRTREERAKVAPPSRSVPASVGAPTFTREGETWLVAFGGESTRMKDADGLRYLAFLVARPNVPVPIVELFAERAGAHGEMTPPSGDAGEVLDREAVASYRARAKDLREALAEAEAHADRGGVERATKELAFLERELSRGLGLGGRERRAGSDQEKIRINVTTRIRKTIDRLRTDVPALARHLDRSVKTGSVCSYEPE